MRWTTLFSLLFITAEAKPHLWKVNKRAEPTKKETEEKTIHFANNTQTKKSTTSKKKTTTKKPTSTTATLSSASLIPSSSVTASSIANSSTALPAHTPMVVSAPSPTSTQPTILATPAAAAETRSNSGLSGGAIGGIVVAVVAVIAGVAALLVFRNRRKKTIMTRNNNSSDPFTVGYSNDNPPAMQQMTSPTHQSFNDPSPTLVSSQQYQAQLQPLAPPPPPLAQKEPQQSLGVYTVAATYSPTLSDEIDIQIGDQVEVLVEYDDGWCQGINLSRNNAKGVFPKHCLDFSSTQKEQTQQDDARVKRVSSMRVGS
ncbi:hypothetical protein RMATCC62417_06131 [Rhizopus microsporus]|nr:hypothetical protein RMATCC62417_06131 [Rhizopus microsporus]